MSELDPTNIGTLPSEEKDPILEMLEKITFNDLVQLVGDPAKSSTDTIPPKLPDSIKKIMEEIKNKKKEKKDLDGKVILKIENCSQEYLLAKNILAYHLKNHSLESTGIPWFDNLLEKIKPLKVIDLDPSISNHLSERQDSSIQEDQSFINEFYSKKSKALVYQRNKEEFFESETIFSENIKRLETKVSSEAGNMLPREIKIKILELSKKIQEKSKEITKEKAQFPKNSSIILKLLKEQTENLKNFSILSAVIKKTGITDAIDQKYPGQDKATNSMYALTQYPFQRILRYKSLLQDTIKNIKKSDHLERAYFDEVINGEIDELTDNDHKTDIGLVVDLVWSKPKECNTDLKEIDKKEKKYHHTLKTILKSSQKSSNKVIQDVLKKPSPENIDAFLQDPQMDQHSKTIIRDLNMAFYKDAMEENAALTKLGLSYTDLFLYEHSTKPNEPTLKPKDFAFGYSAFRAKTGPNTSSLTNRAQAIADLVEIYNISEKREYYKKAIIAFVQYNVPHMDVMLPDNFPKEIKEEIAGLKTKPPTLYTTEKKLEYITRFNKVKLFTEEELLKQETNASGEIILTIQGSEKKHILTLSKRKDNDFDIKHETIDADGGKTIVKPTVKISGVTGQLTISNIINEYPNGLIKTEQIHDFLDNIKKYLKKNHSQEIKIPTKEELLAPLLEESSSDAPDATNTNESQDDYKEENDTEHGADLDEQIKKPEAEIASLTDSNDPTKNKPEISETKILKLIGEINDVLRDESDTDIVTPSLTLTSFDEQERGESNDDEIIDIVEEARINLQLKESQKLNVMPQLPPFSEMTDEQLNQAEMALSALNKEIDVNSNEPPSHTQTDTATHEEKPEILRIKPVVIKPEQTTRDHIARITNGPAEKIEPIKPQDANEFSEALINVEGSSVLYINLLGENLSSYITNQILDRPIADAVDAVFFYLCIAKRLYDRKKELLLADVLNGITQAIQENILLQWEDYEGYIKEMEPLTRNSAGRTMSCAPLIGEGQYLINELKKIKDLTDQKEALPATHKDAKQKSESTEYIQGQLLARTKLPSGQVLVKTLTPNKDGIFSYNQHNIPKEKSMSTEEYHKIRPAL